MGQGCTRTKFEFSYDDEPHKTRREEILKKYPVIKTLMGPDPNFKYITFLMVMFQIVSLYFISDLCWKAVVLLAYCVGGTLNHSLSLAIHEVSHNLAFPMKYKTLNQFYGIFLNLPLGVPTSITFKKYHLDHHRYLGDKEMDVDLPTELEGKFFMNSFTKLVWVILQPLFYAIRPLIIRPVPLTDWEVLNAVVQISFDLIVYYYFGIKAIFYMIGGTLLATGLHPVAGHFISEHYMFKKGYETYSYYGSLNMITFNVGYHNEHHDFPYIPGSRLPKVREIAKEYYDTMPHHDSWVKVLYDFIFDPEIGPYSRVKRNKVKAG